MPRYKIGDMVYAPYVDLENEIVRVDSGVIEKVGSCSDEVEWYYVFGTFYMDNELCSSYQEAAEVCKTRYKSHLRALERQIDQL